MYQVEIDDRVHEVVTLSGDDLMECVEDALSEWMDANGEDLTVRTEATMSVYAGGVYRGIFRLHVVPLDESGSDGEPLLDLVANKHTLAMLEGMR